jgi:hypothetical protein
VATKVELMGLPPELEHRLYERWIDVAMMPRSEWTGAYDGYVRPEDIPALVAQLPEEVTTELKFGPMPEPHCTCCRAMNRDRYLNNVVIHALMDFHDWTYRAFPELRVWQRAAKAYPNCLLIYEAAQAT